MDNISDVHTTLALSEAKDGYKLPVWGWAVFWIMGVIAASGVAHYAVYGVLNGWQVALALFLAINLLICAQEISLYFRIGDIESWFHRPDQVNDVPEGNAWTRRATFRGLFSTRLWAHIWYDYAFYDASYADRKSFGFAVDIGNGFATLLPSLFFLIGMSVPAISPVLLGVVGLVIFYQKFYLTCLYFFIYFFNKRHARLTAAGISTVIIANGIWVVFPVAGLYVSLRLIFDNSAAVLL